MIEICLWHEEAEHAGAHVPDPDRSGGGAPAWLRDHHRRRADLRRRDPAADRDPVHGPGPAEFGPAGRAGPGGNRRRPAAPVLPAHRRGRAAAGRRDRTPARQRRRRGAAAARPARRRHRVSTGGPGRAAGAGGDRPARDPAGTAALERRYRRLLRCYPPSHRALRREEMLGVLLAAARPGQRTPGLGQAVNLAACGLAIRARRIPGWLAADARQDALAVVSLIAPAVVFILLALGWAVNAAAGARVLPRVPVWTPLLPVPVLPLSGESVVVMIAWLAVVVLGLTGGRRTAAKIASISLTLALLALLFVLVVLIQQVHSFYFNTFPGELLPFLPFGDVPVLLG